MKKVWTPEEDSLIIETVKLNLERAIVASKSFVELSEVLGRSDKAIGLRYYRLTKKPKVETKINTSELLAMIQEELNRIPSLEQRIVELEEIETEYKKLIRALDEFRRGNTARPHFKMAPNGDLERID